jgi:hypothetical protein|tara:strand:- start:974 stop:1318 length:345 start_codon:yes stop_codon:yes gene_type:complete
MDKLSTATIYNLETEDEVVRFIPTGFTDGDERLFYVIKESPYTAIWPGSVVSADVLSDKEIKTVFGIKLPINANPISHTIKTTPNDKELGTALRDRQVKLEKSNPTFEFEKYQN